MSHVLAMLCDNNMQCAGDNINLTKIHTSIANNINTTWYILSDTRLNQRPHFDSMVTEFAVSLFLSSTTTAKRSQRNISFIVWKILPILQTNGKIGGQILQKTSTFELLLLCKGMFGLDSKMSKMEGGILN